MRASVLLLVIAILAYAIAVHEYDAPYEEAAAAGYASSTP
jgi:hypothetical protein